MRAQTFYVFFSISILTGIVAGFMLWAISAYSNRILGLDLEEEEPARMPARSIETYREGRRTQSLYSGLRVPLTWHGGRDEGVVRQAILEEDDSES